MLKYINEVEEAKEGNPLSEEVWKAIARREWTTPWGLWYQFKPGDQNYYVYERAGRVTRSYPYINEDLRERARRYLYRVSRDYFLEPSCFTKGRYAINISRGGGWWGDRPKHTTYSLYNIWQFAYYGGLWGMINDGWDLIKRMNSAYQNWFIPGPTSWAEHYHHGAGPGTIAQARLAHTVGDMATYYRDVFLATKILIGEAGWIQGAYPYILKHLPWDQSCTNDAIPVELSTVQGFHFGGINDKHLSPLGGTAYDGIHENFWVFGTEVLLRFWRDHLKEGTRRVLDVVSKRAYPGWDDIPPDKKLPWSLWSLLKMKPLVLEEPADNPVDYLLKRIHYTLWNGPDGSTSLPHTFAVLLNGRRYRQVIPDLPYPTRFIRARTGFGANYIAGGIGKFSPGIAVYQPVFIPPSPLRNGNGNSQNAPYSPGFTATGGKLRMSTLRLSGVVTPSSASTRRIEKLRGYPRTLCEWGV